MKMPSLKPVAVTLALAGTAFAGLTSGASATPTPKVTICHATASATNPYVNITVSQDSDDAVRAYDHGRGDHYAEHTGPIGPLASGSWGDIIPAIPGVHDGRNWTADGQATLANGCVPTQGGPVTTTIPGGYDDGPQY
jgi:hypothetical protein